MKKGFATTYINNDWGLTTPNVYHSAQWCETVPWVYTGGQWKKLGAAGTLLIYWLDSNGDYMMDSDGNYILVRRG